MISVAIEEFKQEDLESAIAKVRVHMMRLCPCNAMWDSQSNMILFLYCTHPTYP